MSPIYKLLEVVLSFSIPVSLIFRDFRFIPHARFFFIFLFLFFLEVIVIFHPFRSLLNLSPSVLSILFTVDFPLWGLLSRMFFLMAVSVL